MPLNQTVFLSSPDRHSVRYRGLAEGVDAGRPQVFFHHGCAYAVDQWPTASAAIFTELLLTTIHKFGIMDLDPYWEYLPSGWTTFYWRVRWTGTSDNIRARLQFDDLEECMR